MANGLLFPSILKCDTINEDNIYTFLNSIWVDARVSIEYADDGSFEIINKGYSGYRFDTMTNKWRGPKYEAIYNGHHIKLPRFLPSDDGLHSLVPYLQKMLSINNIDGVFYLESKTNTFHNISTKNFELIAAQHPYRAEINLSPEPIIAVYDINDIDCPALWVDRSVAHKFFEFENSDFFI